MPSNVIQQALEVTRDNIRSLGPAGALAHVHAPYQDWLSLVERAIEDAGVRPVAPTCAASGESRHDGGIAPSPPAAIPCWSDGPVPDTCTQNRPFECLYIQFSDDLTAIRKWSSEPFEGGVRFVHGWKATENSLRELGHPVTILRELPRGEG